MSIHNGLEFPVDELTQITREFLQHAYADIDIDFVRGIERASSTSGKVLLSKKTKQLLVACRGGQPIGMIITTPKRGGALKCSPIALKSYDAVAFSQLLIYAARAFTDRVSRKLYTHIPYFDTWLLHAAKEHGFSSEGMIRQPYKAGVDMIILGKPTS